MTLGFVILLFILLSFGFFIVEGIIAPSEQMLVRFSLKKTIDEIDDIEGETVDSGVRGRLRDMCHTLINHLPRFNLTNLSMLRAKLDTDPEFRARAVKRAAELDSCANEEVRAIRQHIILLGDRALFWNSVGWVVFLIPVIISLFLAKRIQTGVKMLLTTPQRGPDTFDSSLAC